MTQTATDPRINVSSTVTPPETIATTGIDQSQTPTNYDDVIWVSEALGTLRTHLAKAKREGKQELIDLLTDAIRKNVEDRKLADFEDRYWRHPDETRQSEQMTSLHNNCSPYR